MLRWQARRRRAVEKAADPFELIIWENIAYLANDQRRASAFAELKARVGMEPEAILKADQRTIADIAKAGILADVSAEKLLTVAKIAHEEFKWRFAACAAPPSAASEEGLEEVSRDRRTGG